ncbi:(d)CMP kinase [Candidatus Sororendozoicomonas aggregata]|uniref:(d)CMP kinase n=1 Tax=Candidatus Sororendozoicomonas aggregata TaxID=3073239 RepID=UPI002ED44298
MDAQATIPVITIDGPSGSGKGTLASMLSKALGWKLLDSGALYRLTALCAVKQGVQLSDEVAVAELAAKLDVQFIPSASGEGVDTLLEGEAVGATLRTEETGAKASQVAALPQVRDALLQRQKNFVEAPGLIADGRDMGTVVFPDALAKFFLTASARERANRRMIQLRNRGVYGNFERLLADIKARDERDANRAVAPLLPADDAIVIDSSLLAVDAVFNQLMAELKQRRLL